MTTLGKKRHRSAWATELNDLVWGACGGFLFGIPLLYTIDFLSNRETAEGAFVFSRDPRQGQLTLRVASYKLP